MANCKSLFKNGNILKLWACAIDVFNVIQICLIDYKFRKLYNLFVINVLNTRISYDSTVRNNY